jgi:Transposase DDE domain
VPNQDEPSQFNAAFELLKQYLDIEESDTIQPLGNAAIYTTSVVSWLMLFQRLNPNASLKQAVEHFFANAPKGKGANKRLREGTLSTGSSSYSDARKRLSIDVVDWFQKRLSNSIIESTQPSFNNQRVFLIDGTTLPGFPSAALQRAFPPASNQHGEGVWPVIYLVAAHELSSGAALPPEIGAMYGDQAIAETKLAEPLIARLPEASIVMADAGFGIYSVAHTAREHGHNFVLRLTEVRFYSHKKKATLLESTSTSRIYEYTWKPSAKELATNPSIPADSMLQVRLYEVKIGDHWLYLITDIMASPKAFKDLYFQRNDIEIDIRNIKVVFDTESLKSKSVEMFRKELGMAMVAYNLTSQLRRQASIIAKCTPRELSFTGVWNVYREHIQPKVFKDGEQWQENYAIALDRASKQKLPNRPGRSFPREAYARRPKTTHFQKRKRKEKPGETDDKPLK